MRADPKKARRPHWYRLYPGECPTCGRKLTYRKRVYGKRPRLQKHRVCWTPWNWAYCGCLERGVP